jgi:26S proteasome regulatory subunit N2
MSISQWLSRATNWAKFSATAGLGVIHKGHLKEGRSLLAPYLPTGTGASSSAFSEGGALYGLGIIHANHGEKITDYLLTALTSTSGINGPSETIQHGACLGLGVAGMASGDRAIYNALADILNTDRAVAGEAAGLAIGLVMLGTGDAEALELLVNYGHNTEHEKIIRGVAIGIALIMYAKEDKADSLIEQLLRDKVGINSLTHSLTHSLSHSLTLSLTQ